MTWTADPWFVPIRRTRGFPPQGLGFDPATIAWVNAVIANGGTVSNARETLVDNLIVGLKADGVWTKLDRLWLHAGENQPSALTDIVADSLATAVNSPTFTTDRGFTGPNSASPTTYIDSGYNPTINAVNYTQNSAHLSFWSVGAGSASDTNGVIGYSNSGFTSMANIYDDYHNTGMLARVNDASGFLNIPATRQGHKCVSRTGASAQVLYQNATSTDTPNASSTALVNLNMYILAENSNGSALNGCNLQIAASSMGGGLSSTDVTNFYNRLCDYMGGAFADAWARQVVTNGGTVSAARQTLIANLIAGGMRDGWWFKMDRLWLFAAENSQSALTDIVADALATAVNSPTFTVDRGFTGNGSSMYIDSNFNASTAGGNYTQNSACLLAWNNTTLSAGVDQGPLLDNTTNSNTRLYPHFSDNNTYWSINNAQQAVAAGSPGTGLYVASRTSSSSATLDLNGSQIDSNAAASVIVPNADFDFLHGSNYGVYQICCGGFGGQLSGTDRSNIYSRLRTYMTAIGVP